MSKTFLLAVVAVAAFAVAPALADGDCGSVPLAPAIPPASDLAGKAQDAQRAEVVDAYHQVKAYQGALQPYRQCLAAKEAADKAALTDAQSETDKDKQKEKVDELVSDMKLIVSEINSTIDTEQQVATDFNTLHTEECKTDTDPKICPKH
jgi:hypothetical protein